MKLSMKFLSILALFVSLNLTVHAQRGDKSITPEQRAEKITNKMTEKLNLDASQAAQVKDLNLSLASKMKAIRNAHEGDRAAMKAEILELREDHKADLKPILNDEQWEKFMVGYQKRLERIKDRKGKSGK